MQASLKALNMKHAESLATGIRVTMRVCEPWNETLLLNFDSESSEGTVIIEFRYYGTTTE